MIQLKTINGLLIHLKQLKLKDVLRVGSWWARFYKCSGLIIFMLFNRILVRNLESLSWKLQIIVEVGMTSIFSLISGGSLCHSLSKALVTVFILSHILAWSLSNFLLLWLLV